MPDEQGDLSEPFIAQQRTRLEALRRELLGGEENAIADERRCELDIVNGRWHSKFPQSYLVNVSGGDSVPEY